MSVPRMQPTRAKRRFIGWRAVANPFSSSVRVSIRSSFNNTVLTNPLSVRLLKKVQMQGGEGKAE
jgi:hypothetical protein